MLGIRLSADAETMLERHAKALGRGKSVIVREWIIERLERESVDAEMCRAAVVLAASDRLERTDRSDAADHLRALDDEDGGYDWGAEGAPV